MADLQRAFLQSIHETPEDDAPRLIYADWLEEHGQPERAEFIRLQCRLANAPADDPHRAAWIKRYNELIPLREFIQGAWRLTFEHQQMRPEEEVKTRNIIARFPEGIRSALGNEELTYLRRKQGLVCTQTFAVPRHRPQRVQPDEYDKHWEEVFPVLDFDRGFANITLPMRPWYPGHPDYESLQETGTYINRIADSGVADTITLTTRFELPYLGHQPLDAVRNAVQRQIPHDEEQRQFFSALTEGAMKKIHTLTLDHFVMDFATAQQIAACRAFKGLHQLSLSDCHIGSEEVVRTLVESENLRNTLISMPSHGLEEVAGGLEHRRILLSPVMNELIRRHNQPIIEKNAQGLQRG